jgi:hypothetical protein
MVKNAKTQLMKRGDEGENGRKRNSWFVVFFDISLFRALRASHRRFRQETTIKQVTTNKSKLESDREREREREEERKTSSEGDRKIRERELKKKIPTQRTNMS